MLEQHTDLDESIQATSVDEARQALRTHNDEVALAILAIDLFEEEEIGLIEDLNALAIPVLTFTDDQCLERRRARALRAGADGVLYTAASGENVDAVKRPIRG